ncbi:MAG: hypothetical protein ABI746_00740 [Dermatophilaceae bacterium]
MRQGRVAALGGLLSLSLSLPLSLSAVPAAAGPNARGAFANTPDVPTIAVIVVPRDPSTTVTVGTGVAVAQSSTSPPTTAPPTTAPHAASPPTESAERTKPLTAQAIPDEPVAADLVRHIDCQSGNDSQDGSPAAPWRTPQSLAGRSLAVGTQLLLRRGCSWDGPVRVTGDRITLGTYGSGTAPRVTANGADRRTPVLTMASAGGTVSDLVIADGAGAGVQLAAEGATVTRTEITGTAFGVQFTAPDGVADAVYVHDLHMDINTPGGDDDSGAVGFDVRASRATVQNSHAVNCRASSYDYGHDGGFVEVWKKGDGLRVLNNTAVNVSGFLEAGGEGGADSFHGAQIVGNHVAQSHGGIGVHSGGGYAIEASGIVFRENRIQVTDGEITYGNRSALSIDRSNVIGAGAPATVIPRAAGPASEQPAPSSPGSPPAAASSPAAPSAPAAPPPSVGSGPTEAEPILPHEWVYDGSAREWVYDPGVDAWGLWEWRSDMWVLLQTRSAQWQLSPEPPAPAR